MAFNFQIHKDREIKKEIWHNQWERERKGEKKEKEKKTKDK